MTVEALGDSTLRLEQLVEPGMPAVIGGPHGRFSTCGAESSRCGSPPGSASRRPQLAAGARRPPPHRVDFFYTADGDAPFADEIDLIAGRHVSLHAPTCPTSARSSPKMPRAAGLASSTSRCACSALDTSRRPRRCRHRSERRRRPFAAEWFPLGTRAEAADDYRSERATAKRRCPAARHRGRPLALKTSDHFRLSRRSGHLDRSVNRKTALQQGS